MLEAAHLERSADQRASPIADHRRDAPGAERRGAKRHQELVDGVGEIRERVDQRTVQIENGENQTGPSTVSL